MEKNQLEVWFAIDSRTDLCGYVAARSILENRSLESHTKICIAYEFSTPPPAKWWDKKLADVKKSLEIRHVPVDLGKLGKCKGVFDSKAAFIRILIPNYSKNDKIIYADADILFLEDAENLLENHLFDDHSIALVPSDLCGNRPHIEKELLKSCGKKPADYYFNSGLALINTEKYRSERISEQAIEFAEKNRSILPFHDQTIWNCIIKNAGILDEKWCHYAYPKIEDKVDWNDGILHFVGSPKPWDLLGEFFHPYAETWYEVASKAGIQLPKISRYFKKEYWKRAYRIRNQYKSWLT